MFESFLTFIIGFYMVVQCQYNFNIHFPEHFPDLATETCPDYHVNALGLYPHKCVSYLNECLGVTQVEIKKAHGIQILCHPNYQVNFSTKARKHKNFWVDPTQSISLSIDSNYQFHYTKDIQIPNCFIVYVWYTKVSNQKSYHCLYYSGAYVVGYKPYNITAFYLGGYDEFSAIDCPSQACNGCTFSPDMSSYNCTKCFGDNYVDANTKDCSLCIKMSSSCDEQHPIPIQCRPGFRKVTIDANTFQCDACTDKNCTNCDNGSPCTQCDVHMWRNFDFIFYSNQNSDKLCKSIEDCIEYSQNSANLQCLQTSIGFYLQDPFAENGNKFCIYSLPHCYHCSSATVCKVCNFGFNLYNNQCIKINPCLPTCQTCLTSNTNICTSCFQDEVVQNGQCICPIGNQFFYIDGHCVNCKSRICEICLGAIDDCLTCKPETFRYLNGKKCFCMDGYYDGEDEYFICQKCHPTCSTCFGGEFFNCISCDTQQNRHLNQGQCVCDQGLGELDINYSNIVCQKCHSRCKSCIFSNDPSSCTSCFFEQFRQLSANQGCKCIDNYGESEIPQDICINCHFSCGSCTGILSTNCTQCLESSHRYQIDNICICQKGYFESPYSQTECLSCHYSCADCLANSGSDECTECPVSRISDGSGTTFSCICEDSNYFDDGQSQECQQCHYSCLTCMFSGLSSCLSCDLTVRKFSYQKCLCLESTFDDGISSCLPCHSTCQTCSGQEITDCLICSTDIEFRQLIGGSCICLDGYFEDNGQQICSKCSYKCKTCSGQENQCLSCVENTFRYLSNDSDCLCPQGLYDSEGISLCINCHQKCQGCFGIQENQCVDCKPWANRYLSQNECICQPHYYEEDVENCSICSGICFECSITNNNCTSCQNDRYLEANTCLCGTKLHGLSLSTYEVIGQLQCLKCHYSCLTCNGPTSSRCTSCSEVESRYLVGSQCLCTAGYFDSGFPQCQKCGYQCSSCIYQENQCLSCEQNTFRLLNIQGQLCSCQTGYYDDGINSTCQQCNYTCLQCSIKQNHCLTCQIDSYRQFDEILFTCRCISGYYDGGQAICQPCHYSCYECYGSSNQQCKSCKSFNISKRAFLDGKCICQTGYYDDGYSSNCQPCDVSCRSCEIESYHCTASSTSRKYSNSSCLCQSGYFDIGQSECVICNSNCLQCKINAATCIACDSNKFRILNDQTKTCVCQSKYLEKNGECLQCDSSCLTCSTTITNCSSCDSNRNLSNNQCLCQDGFFNFQGDCQICHKSYLTCKDNQLFCLSCSSQNYRQLSINHTCDCIDGYFDQLTTNSCEQCDYSCKTCSQNSTNCTSCEISQNYDIFQNKCLCKLGYYYDQPTKICLKCHISCLTCIQYENVHHALRIQELLIANSKHVIAQKVFMKLIKLIVQCVIINVSQKSSFMSFSFEIRAAELLCQFENAVSIQDYREELILHIVCKDLNTNNDWNKDNQLQIDINCTDLSTTQSCMNQQQNQMLKISPNDYYQKVPKYSAKPFSAQSWKVTATKVDLKKTFEQIIVFLEDNFPALTLKYDIAYSIRPINNFELLNFTFDVPIEKRQNIVQIAVAIISDFELLSLTKPKYYKYQMKLQDQIGEKTLENNKYNFRFSVQYSTNINPSCFSLPITLNIPPICSKILQSQQNLNSLTQVEIVTICSKAEDSPYQYKFGYFLQEQDLKEYQTGNTALTFGETSYQVSNKLTSVVPNSFLNQSILFVVSIMDQRGSITNIFGKIIAENHFNCKQINNQNSFNIKPNLLLTQIIQAAGQEGEDCSQLKQTNLLRLYNQIDFSSQELNILLKALQISKKNQSIPQSNSRRILDESEFQSCYNLKNKTFQINQTLRDERNDKSSILEQIDMEISNFQSAITFLTSQHDKLKLLLQNQNFDWDQILYEEYDLIQTSLQQLYLLPDNILLKLSKFESIDELIYHKCFIILNSIQKLSVLIQESATINGNPITMFGEMISWRLVRQSRENLKIELGLQIGLEDQIIKFSQKESIEIKLNPFKFSNQTMSNLTKQFNNSNLIIDPNFMVQTQFKNFHQSGYQVIQNEMEGKYKVNISKIINCSDQSSQYPLQGYKAICILLQQNSNSITQCSNSIVQQNNDLHINCECSAFGQIFLIYYHEVTNIVNNNNTIVQEVFQNGYNFSLSSITIFSPITICYIAYMGLVGFITLLLFFSKKQPQITEENITEPQKDPLSNSQIKCYPGDYIIIKQNFKFLHQLSQFCFDSGSLIGRPFYFIDINTQFCLMLLILYLINIDLGKYQNLIEIIFLSSCGVIFRIVSKILQGFARINIVLKIIIYTFLGINLVISCTIIALQAIIQSKETNYEKIQIFLIGIVMYEVLIESILIISCVFSYRLTFKSIRQKEFKLFYHLIYYFAYQEKLEKEFQQYFII